MSIENRRKPYVAFSKTKQNKFLKALEKFNSVARAAKSTGVTRATVYNCRKRDPDFDRRMQEVQDSIVDSLEAEAIRRARDGVVEPVYSGGKQVGEKVVYSDALLALLLKSYKGDVFGNKSEVSLKGTGPNGEIQIVDQAKGKLASLLGLQQGITIDQETEE